MALITIDEPQGIYYGGTIAAPVIGELFQKYSSIYGNPAGAESWLIILRKRRILLLLSGVCRQNTYEIEVPYDS